MNFGEPPLQAGRELTQTVYRNKNNDSRKD